MHFGAVCLEGADVDGHLVFTAEAVLAAGGRIEAERAASLESLLAVPVGARVAKKSRLLPTSCPVGWAYNVLQQHLWAKPAVRGRGLEAAR